MVVVALPGTVLPGGFTIASRPTYGQISDGMICSVKELGIGTEHDGILVLAGPDQDIAEIGSDARSLIGSDDVVIELAITPDRGYALSIRGLARELAAGLRRPVHRRRRAPGPGRGSPGTLSRSSTPQAVARFVTVDVTGVDPSASSPWTDPPSPARRRASGRSRSPST